MNQSMGIHFVIFVFVNIEIFGYLFSTSQSTITNHINQILITCNTKYTITLHQHPSHNILFWWIWKIKDKTLLLSENRIDGLRCSVISRRSVLLVEEIWVPGENHWPVASHWQTWSHIVVSSTPWHEHGWNSQL